MAEIEETKIKKPQFIIFTDKDGTLNLEDKHLNNILNLIITMGGMVIPITGRTVGDIEESIRKQNINVPEILVGDNGANIYSTKNNTFLIKRKLEHEKVMQIVDEYVKNCGNKNYIRYTDGNNIFASKEKDVREYYRKSKATRFYEDIYRQMKQTEDITKITLTGSKEQMMKSAEFAKKLDFWTDMDKTEFPKREYGNYRLDISQKNINKGEAIKAIVSQLKPRYGYICIGNGYNDISMFETAIDDGMIVAIMANSSSELIEEVLQYSKSKKRGRIMLIPDNKDLANKYILKMAKMFQSHIKKQERKINRKKRKLPNIKRIRVKEVELKNINSNMSQKSKNR